MWKGSEMDPSNPEGGGPSSSNNPPPNEELINLKDQYEQQQVLISQLKEMLRKNEQTTVTPEKVEEYANTLNRMRAKAKQSKLQKGNKESKDAPSEPTGSRRPSTVNIQAKEKIMLLRQKVEENKVKLAKRDKHHKGLEELVIQLKAQLDDSQQFINQTPLNLSIADPKIENFSSNSSSEELYNALLLKEKYIGDLTSNISKLEANVLDLQENLKEKDSVIDARTKAITLMSENMSKKNKVTVDELEDTKEQMKSMQENFVSLEMQLNSQKQNLLKQLKEKNYEIEQFQIKCKESNDKNTEYEETIKNLEVKIKELENQTTENESQDSIKKGSKKYIQLQKKVEELEAIISNKTEELENVCKQLSTAQSEIDEKDNENNTLKNKLTKLQKEVENKQLENENCLSKIKELDDKLNSVKKEEPKKIYTVSSEHSEEVSMLKKQLEEFNKNMIKVKAQHKSKLKELSKKIEEFKKISDVNAEVVKLRNENDKLKQQVTDLESKVKECSAPDTSSETEKDNMIASLKEEIQIYQSEVTALKDQLDNLSVLENAQVTSEINSIHLEEKIDNLETQVRKLEEDKVHISEENLNLLEKIEDLKREKLDIQTRLDQCLQENMDLIDKLDKLSAEKVSSAESIEIVEGLTHQEKLELEAYQKGIESNVGSDINKSEEHLEQNIELNESVNQLTEETSDLLRKIELFTEERREVMEKMERITLDNNKLQLKIKEIENNRDVLAETYEQLQNEKEDLGNKVRELEDQNIKLKTEIEELKQQQQEVKHGNFVEETIDVETVTPLSPSEDINKKLQEEIVEYKSLIDIQKQEIRELKLQLLSSNTSDDLKQELANLEVQYEALLSENKKLKEAVKTNSELVHEKDSIEEELRDARKKADDLETKLTNALKEINNFKTELTQKYEEINSSNNTLTHLEDKIEEQKAELVHYESTVDHLNKVISDLTDKSNELQSLKETYERDVKEIELYEGELTRNTAVISNLENELKRLNNRLLETEHLLGSKDDEITQLKKESETKEKLINNLKEEMQNKDKMVHNTFDQLRDRCHAMQNQIDGNEESMKNIRAPLEEKIKELERRNKEQLEKMKKLAANLKKKTLQYQELEKQLEEMTKSLKDQKETFQMEVKEKDQTISKIKEEFHEVYEKLRAHEEKEKTIKQIQMENSQLQSKINQYIAINNDLENTKTDYEAQITTLSNELEIMRSNINNSMNSEINNKNAVINELNENIETLKYNHETSLNAAQAKVLELEAYIETQEAELIKYKTKATKLEEGLMVVEERRASLERRAIELGAQLEEKSHNYEEISHTEDILEQRLSALLIHDEIVEKRLQETMNENHELSERNRFLLEENTQLREELSSASGKIVDVSDFIQRISYLENENAKLSDAAINFENEYKRLQVDLNKKILDKERELDTLENELQNQLEMNSNERKNLLVQSELLQDQLKESQDNQELLQEELNDCKNKLGQLMTDYKNTIAELNQFKIDRENNLATIQQLQFQLENISNHPTPRSSETLQKDTHVVELQSQKNVSSYFEMSPQDFFSEKTPLVEDNKVDSLTRELLLAQKTIDELNTDKKQLENKILEIENQYNDLNSEVVILKKMQAKLISQEIVDEIVKVAERRVSEEGSTTLPRAKSSTKSEHIVSINWDAVSDDPFAFVNETSLEPKHVEVQEKGAKESGTTDNIQKELENKIKTLQFLLFNTEKEKDELLSQCNQLTNEIAQLIYDKQNSQISQENNEPSSDKVDSQVIPPHEVEISEQERKQLQNIEFNPVRLSESDGLRPVEEVVNPPKVAYLEYNPDDHQRSAQPPFISGDIFENDDGWGWGPEEAKIEEEHVRKTANPQTADTSGRISQLEERIRVLELDRERHLEDIRQLQVKAGKLIKKLKELKSENDNLKGKKSRANEMSGLEDAIQEELKSQISSLEKKIKEVNGELEKERKEKSNLLKRIDVLTASHERMLEIKEKQDIEMIGWQQRNRELSSRLEQFEWGDRDHESPVKQLSSQQPSDPTQGNIQQLLDKINELNEAVKELTLDNEELQALLEEQRNLRISLERSKSLEPISENQKTEAEENKKIKEKLKSLEKELDSTRTLLQDEVTTKLEFEKTLSEMWQQKEILEEKLKESHHYIEELQTKLNNQNKETESSIQLKDKLETLERENSNLVSELNSLNLITEQLKKSHLGTEDLPAKVEKLTKKKTELFNALQESNVQNQNLNEMISEATRQIFDLEGQVGKIDNLNQNLNEVSAELSQCRNELSIRQEQCLALKNELQQKIDENEELSKQLNEKTELCLKFENETAKQSGQLAEIRLELSNVNEQVNVLNSTLQSKDSEYEAKLTETIQQLTQEWSERVDQRGTDVAESWKLHLETRETEFMQIEQQLRKDIFDLESKFNGLVNENNELRKNVDAEIRNEVDRISALQQQIHDGQITIKQLTSSLEEKQQELVTLSEKFTNQVDLYQKITNELNEKTKTIESLQVAVRGSDTVIKEKQELCENLEKELEKFKDAFNENLHSLSNCQKELALEKEARYSLEKLKNDNKNYIQSISQKLEETTLELNNAYKSISALDTQIKTHEERIISLLKDLQEKDTQLQYYAQQNNSFETLMTEMRNKDSVIDQMQALLAEKQREFSYTLESKLKEKETEIADTIQELNFIRQRLIQTENHYEELLNVKESDIQNLQATLQEQSNRNEEMKEEVKEDLTRKENESQNLHKALEEQKIKLDGYRNSNEQLEQQNEQLLEENKQISELQKIIEDQVLRIEELKQQLLEKSKDYDSLIAEMEMQITPRSSTIESAPFVQGALSERNYDRQDVGVKKETEEDILEPVSRAELDIALYMLHQRDVRCEELTLELVQLLEERDTLQLKLSNALREKEMLRAKILDEEPIVEEREATSSTGAVPRKVGSEFAPPETTRRSAQINDDSLTAKLSELKSVSYRKDKTYLDDQEQRRFQELAIMRQCQEVGAMLPPEAAAKLVQDANYTLSRDVQSPSKVLLNWLWGRSTPKVNET